MLTVEFAPVEGVRHVRVETVTEDRCVILHDEIRCSKADHPEEVKGFEVEILLLDGIAEYGDSLWANTMDAKQLFP